MNQIEFYKEIVNAGVYTVFNELRSGLFGSLATDSHIPISYNKLDEELSDMEYPSELIKSFVKEYVGTGSRFRHHQCAIEGLQVHYFVDVTKACEDNDNVAVHFQTWEPTKETEWNAVSAIVLYENHIMLKHPVRYPKIIKHELTHVAIEYVIGKNKTLSAYYFSGDPETNAFIEFICDLIPYVSTPSKKESGINKFIADSVECFGYDAEEGQPAAFIKTVIESMKEEEDPSVEEPTYEEFKSLKDKYSFILRKTDGENRCKLLGIVKSMYYDKESAIRWHQTILDILGDPEDDDTEKAIATLHNLFERMVEE